MAIVKTSELTGKALNWAVSEALGHEPVYNMKSHGIVWWGWWERTPKTPTGEYRQLRNYSIDCAQGGPIIEREKISIDSDRDEWNAAKDGCYWFISGPTPLIAAMRCYVASELGDEVDIPEELLK